MKFTGSVGEDRQLIIPKEVMESLHLQPGATVDVEICEVPVLKPRSFDEKRLREALDKYGGSMREQMLAEGFESVDQLMDDIRPRW